MMYYCKNCGSALPKLAGFCPHCGYKLSEEVISKKTPDKAEDEKCKPEFTPALPKDKKPFRRALLSVFLALIPLFGFGFALGTACSKPVLADKKARRLSKFATLLSVLVIATGTFLIGWLLL